MAAATGYAKNGSAHIAYSVVGTGPTDVLAISTNTFSIDARDQEPHVAHFDRRLASLGRLIRYDPRGVGRSDPVDLAVPLSLENTARDVLAVLDATGSERAVLVADDGGAAVAIVLAVMAPARVDRLVILNGYARVMTAYDYPRGHPPEFVASFVDLNIDPDAEWSVDGSDDRVGDRPDPRRPPS
jgi:pimeloyl-ACP methyl ester carboxylesterase